jgi:methylglutaconyl-CoA hydratase
MAEEVLLLERGAPMAGAATVTLNRPTRGNALTAGMLERLNAILHELERDPSVLVVVLAARGKFFCTGMDLAGSGPTSMATGGATENAFLKLAGFGKPLVARVQGPCLGGGVGLLFCCDFRIATENVYEVFAFFVLSHCLSQLHSV